MTPDQLKQFVTKQLEDNKADDIRELDVSALTSSFDSMLICTGTSTRHVQSIAKKLVTAVKEADIFVLGLEGELYGEWVLVDLGDIVIHVMLKSQRELYQLEKLWAATESFKKQRTA